MPSSFQAKQQPRNERGLFISARNTDLSTPATRPPGAFLDGPDMPTSHPPVESDDSDHDHNDATNPLPSALPTDQSELTTESVTDPATSALPSHPQPSTTTHRLPPVIFTFPRMSHSAIMGPAAMPSARSNKAPLFSGEPQDLKEFLTEYDDLAEAHHLTDKQKSENIIKYIPFDLRDLWCDQDSYATSSWDAFKKELTALYPDDSKVHRNTKQHLRELVRESARSRMHTTSDLSQYYRKFLTIAGPLVRKGKLSADDRDEQFWAGFHPANQDRLEDHLFTAHPNHDTTTPYDFQVVYDAARALFSRAQFCSQGHRWDVPEVDSDSDDKEVPARC